MFGLTIISTIYFPAQSNAPANRIDLMKNDRQSRWEAPRPSPPPPDHGSSSSSSLSVVDVVVVDNSHSIILREEEEEEEERRGLLPMTTTTKVCHFFLRGGDCKHGNSCRFSHQIQQQEHYQQQQHYYSTTTATATTTVDQQKKKKQPSRGYSIMDGSKQNKHIYFVYFFALTHTLTYTHTQLKYCITKFFIILLYIHFTKQKIIYRSYNYHYRPPKL